MFFLCRPTYEIHTFTKSMSIFDFPKISIRYKENLPPISAIYVVAQYNMVLYVGMTKNLRERWKNHHRHYEIVKQYPYADIYFQYTEESKLKETEREFIKKLNPIFNRVLRPEPSFHIDGKPHKYHYFGLDIGSNSTKLIGENFKLNTNTYISSKHPLKALGCVQINGMHFSTGTLGLDWSIYSRRSRNGFYLSNPEHLIELYLGALAHYPCPKQMHTRIVLSSFYYSYIKKWLREEIKRFNEKNPVVILAGKPVILTTEILLCTPQGYGVAYKTKNIATFDFGYDKTMLTVYIEGKPQEPIVEHFGVKELLELIKKEAQDYYKKIFWSEDIIEEALIRKEFQIKDTTVNFEKIYRKCLSNWWSTHITELEKKANELVEKGFKVICTGGGSLLPMLDIVLTKNGFELTANSDIADAEGLYNLAVWKGNKNDETISN
jgi:predicted GIY-YIG superfamily endonuclease